MHSRSLYTIIGLLVLPVVPAWLILHHPDPFISFQLQLNSAGTVIIQWKTNIPNARYEIQRSGDQRKWETFDVVPKQLVTQFTRVNVKPLKGISYYRIKLVTANGDTFFSKAQSINVVNTDD